MIDFKIKGGFIRDIDGDYHNLKMMKTIYISRQDEDDHRIWGIHATSSSMNFPNILGEGFKTLAEAEAALDYLMRCIDSNQCCSCN